MITCKEDLVNTYIENDKGVLRDVYVSLMKLHSVHSCGEKDFGYILDKPFFGCYQWDYTGGLQAEWNQQCPLEGCKQLALTDLLPTSYENTKVYSLDEDVIRKYAELCGAEIIGDRIIGNNDVGVRLRFSQNEVRYFGRGSLVDQDRLLTTITPEQILAAWDLKFGEISWSKGDVGMDMADDMNDLLDDLAAKPTRTKVEYVKCHQSESIKGVMNGDDHYWCKSGESYVHLNMGSPLEQFCRAYRRTEVEIDIKEEVRRFIDDNHHLDADCAIDVFLDSATSDGDRAWDVEWIKMCHLVSSLTPKP